MILRLRVGRYRSEGLPFLAACLAWSARLVVGGRISVQGIYFIDGAALGRGYRRWFEQVGVRLGAIRPLLASS